MVSYGIFKSRAELFKRLMSLFVIETVMSPSPLHDMALWRNNMVS